MQNLLNVLKPLLVNTAKRKFSFIGEPLVKEVQNENLSHTPIMTKEVLDMLNLQEGGVYLDMTFGAGGHTRKILEHCRDTVVFGLDRDPVAFENAKHLEKEYPGRFTPLLGRFSEIPHLVKQYKIPPVNGILMDLGCSSMQFDDPARGFSVSKEGPLDMRMDGTRFPDQPTAAEILEHIDEEDLAKILKFYGEEKYASKIARGIIEARYMFKRLRSTAELSHLVDSLLNSEKRFDKLGRPTHTATKTFQAIRIFVNNEINELNLAMEISHTLLHPGGRLVTLTFHSLEDRIVKRHIHGIDMDEPVSKTLSQKYRNAAAWHNAEELNEIFDKKWISVNKHVIIPSRDEVELNSRCRSAKLRCAIKNVR